jgi:hypothetical protein
MILLDQLGDSIAKRLDLLQGTLDMLILKAVSLDRLHGYGILLRIQQISGERLQIQQGSLSPPSTVWNTRDSSPANGVSPKISARQNTTGSPPQAAGSFTTNSKIGGGWPTSLGAS